MPLHDAPSVDRRTPLSRRLAAALAAAMVAGCAPPAWASESDLWRSYEQGDFFALRDHLPPARVDETRRVRFLRAATQVAFGDHAAAKRTLRQLLAGKPDPATEGLARRLLMREERAAGHYRAALAAIEPLLAAGSGEDASQQADLRNLAVLLGALADVSPQKLEPQTGAATIRRDANGRFPVTVNGHEMALGFDTGANFSILAASTARKAALEIRPAKVALGSSTGVDAGVNVAVGDLTLGSSRIRNVVFLVVPDAGLTMPDGFFMPGLMGFPVMSELGAIRYTPDGAARIGVTAPAMRRPNMALQGSDVLVRVGFRSQQLVCRLDTGADNTVFYEPFYRRFPDLFTDPSRRHDLKLGGVSGAHDIAAYKLASAGFVMAGRPIHVVGPDVMQASIAKTPQDNYLACNLGLDAFRSFGSYTIDLKTLRLSLQDAPGGGGS